MNDDLISRKAILEILYDISNRNYGSFFGHGINKARDVIEHAETAFNKEKVIEELKEIMRSVQFAQSLIGTDSVQCGGFSYGYYNGVKDVIEIVEKGGIK